MAIGVFLATIAGFVLSATYYALVPDLDEAEDAKEAADAPMAAIIPIELARCAAVAGLIGGLVSVAEWTTATEGALLGLALWTMPVTLLVGSVVHEGTAPRAAFLHAGDWFIKLLAIGLIVGWLA